MAIIVWAAKRWLWKDIVIVTYNIQILKFCKKSNIKFFEINKNPSTHLGDIIAYRNYLKKLALEFTNIELVFGHNSHDYWGLYLIRCMEKGNNKIYYNSQLKEHPKQKRSQLLITKKGRGLLKDTIVLFLILKQRFDVLFFESYSFIGMDIKRILKKYTEKNSKQVEEIFILNQKQIQLKYELNSMKVILADQGEAFYYYTSELIRFLISFGSSPNMIYLKQHPTLLTKNEELLNELIQIPNEIPLELVVTDEVIVIGIASSSMLNKNKNVSLVKMVEMKIEDRKKYLEFVESTSAIIPKSIEELDINITSLIND